MSNKVTLALVQMGMSEDVESNVKTAQKLIGDAAGQGADIVCLPEMYRSLYFPQDQQEEAFDLAEPLDGDSFTALAPMAKQFHVVIIVPIFERRMAGIYHNSVLVIDENGHRVGVYRKTHIPHDPSFHEKYFFTPGDELTPIITLKGVKVAVLICWDQWFPEGARLAAIAGAELIIYPTAIGLLPEEQGTAEGEHIKDAWRTIQRGHAIANGCYVAAVNRVGTERSKERESDITFFGSSFCTGPMGELLATAAIDQEEIVLVDIHTAAIESTRRIWPFLRDRRVDLYGDITRRAIDELSK